MVVEVSRERDPVIILVLCIGCRNIITWL